MHDTTFVLAVVLVSALVTIILRILPFTALTFFNENAYLRYLSQHMPVGVTLLLVAYTFKDIQFGVAPFGVPIVLSAVFCVLAFLVSRYALWAIAVGLGSHLLMVNTDILSMLLP